jgi:hypothetical protein
MHARTFILMKAPKESQVALSNQVKESVNMAVSNLRDALAFAARSEHPIVINTIADMLIRLESIESLEGFMQRFNDQSPNSTGTTPPFHMG